MKRRLMKRRGKAVFGSAIVIALFLVSISVTVLASDLFEVVETGDLALVERLISEGADVNQRRADGVTVLMRAVRYNRNPDIVKILIDSGATIDARDESDETALMWAVFHRTRFSTNYEVLSHLIEAGLMSM